MIKFRDYLATDADRLVELANNEKVSRYLIYTFPYPYTRQNAQWWIETGANANNAVTKVIEFHGEFIGSIGITPQTGWKEHTAEIGYWLGERYWGNGIATEALQLMTHMVFSDMNYKKLFAGVLGANRASIRVLEKCGYVLEGVFKQDVFKGGQYHDIHHYAKHRI